MEMVAKVGTALQQLLGPIAEKVAEQTGVIQRRREFSPMSLAATFVLGYLWKPQASVDQLSKMAVQVGAEVTPQAVDQRRTPQLATFLEQLFRESLLIVVASSRSLAPLLERFSSVTVLDSTSITLPDSQQEHFAGCGGSYSTSQAAMKLQTELDLRGGGLSHVEMESGKSPDGATVRQHARRGPGSLRIADLGYFNVPVFAEMVEAKEHFLSRLQFGTGVLLPDGTPVELLRWLKQQPGGAFIDCPILLGLRDRLPCRLIAWRVPPEQANRRRQKLRRNEAKTRQRTQCRTDGLVRLGDLGHQRSSRIADAAGNNGTLPSPLADRITVQTLEIARSGGCSDRLDGPANHDQHLVAVDCLYGAALVARGDSVGKRQDQLG